MPWRNVDRRYKITDAKAIDQRSYLLDDSRTIGHRHERKAQIWIESTFDNCEVNIIQRSRFHPHEQLPRSRCRHFNSTLREILNADSAFENYLPQRTLLSVIV